MKTSKLKKIAGKVQFAAAAFALAMTPSAAGAEAPSAIVNRVTEGVYSEFEAIAFKLGLCAMVALLIAYFMTGDEHKKGKIKLSILAVPVVLLIINVLPGFVEWFQNFA